MWFLICSPIRFGELVWQTNGEFEEKFRARGLEIVCKIPEEPMIIMADGRRMWRVVENLYNNVAKYAMPDTRVYVEVRKIGCRIVFEIKNISERPLNIKAEELTERFIRGDVSRSTEGSGLGLSIAKKIIEEHGGKIWAVSTEGVGTTMCFVLRKYKENNVYE